MSRWPTLARTVWCVALVLSSMGPAKATIWPNAVEQVAQNLSSAEVALRRSAALELTELPGSVARRLLPTALADADSQVRLAAAEAAIHWRFEPASAAVRPWLSDRDAQVRRAATQVLGSFRLNREGVSSLGRALADPEMEVRRSAAQSLGASRSKEATLALLGHLDDSRPEVQLAVVGALQQLGDQRAIMPLVSKIQDPRSSVRQAVARALGALGGQRVMSGLLLALRDKDRAVRRAAVTALGQVGTEAAAEALANALKNDADLMVRVAALRALRGHATPSTARWVIEALDMDRVELKHEAQSTLTAIAPGITSQLRECLRTATATRRADGCARALASTDLPEAFEEIRSAWQSRTLSAIGALEALGTLGDRRALPTVLESLLSENLSERGSAVFAADAILERAGPDGRAVEPIVEALARPGISTRERVALVTLLGKTRSHRAGPQLRRFTVTEAPIMVRIAALRALGNAAARTESAALLAALNDSHARVRREAAVAIRKVASAELATSLLGRLESETEQDRMALAIALLGPLSHATSPELARRTHRLILRNRGALRDALIEALGAMATPEAGQLLSRLALMTGAPTRAKVAESLAARSDQRDVLLNLAKDSDTHVRSNAIWALGADSSVDLTPIFAAALGDRDSAVAGNAAAALARWSRGQSAKAQLQAGARLCSALEDGRPYVRANALAGLRLLSQRCPKRLAAWLLAGDPHFMVRLQAARLLSSVTGGQQPEAVASSGERNPDPSDQSDLDRCAAEDTHGEVAAACSAQRGQLQAEPQSAGGHPVTVYVVPSGKTKPVPLAPFALQLPNGLLRLGVADRRGAVFEKDAPLGSLRLAVPAPLVR